MMQDPVRIVPMAAEHPASVDLVHRYFAELAARFPGGFEPEPGGAAPAQEMSPPGGVFLIALAGTVAAGCGGLRALTETEAEVKHMWVDPQWRGRGIARRLLAALEHAAADLGYLRARLDTSVHLPEAIALYRSSGWEESPPYNANPYAGHWFVKELR